MSFATVAVVVALIIFVFSHWGDNQQARYVRRTTHLRAHCRSSYFRNHPHVCTLIPASCH
jgi:hypothetical protein